MGFEFITYEKQGASRRSPSIARRSMNALHPPANLELSAAFDDFAAEPECWVAIVTGAGERRSPPATI